MIGKIKKYTYQNSIGWGVPLVVAGDASDNLVKNVPWIALAEVYP